MEKIFGNCSRDFSGCSNRIFLAAYFLCDKEPLEFKVKTIRIETAKDSYAAGNKLSEKSFSVYASDGNTEKLLDSEKYTVSPKSVPEHGHSVTVTVSSTDTKKSVLRLQF